MVWRPQSKWNNTNCPLCKGGNLPLGIDTGSGGFNCKCCGAKGRDFIAFEMALCEGDLYKALYNINKEFLSGTAKLYGEASQKFIPERANLTDGDPGYIFFNSPPVENHPYLKLKNDIKSHGLRTFAGAVPHGANKTLTNSLMAKLDWLMVPAYSKDGDIINIQFISRTGKQKLFLETSSKGGFFTIGQVTNIILLVEGYGAGASLYESTGYYQVVTFGITNFETIGLIAREKHPTARLIFCPDYDPEFRHAIAAAKAAALCGGEVIVPHDGDFNDFPDDFELSRVKPPSFYLDNEPPKIAALCIKVTQKAMQIGFRLLPKLLLTLRGDDGKEYVHFFNVTIRDPDSAADIDDPVKKNAVRLYATPSSKLAKLYMQTFGEMPRDVASFLSGRCRKVATRFKGERFYIGGIKKQKTRKGDAYQIASKIEPVEPRKWHEKRQHKKMKKDSKKTATIRPQT